MFTMREIKHSEVEEQYTKEYLNEFYNKVKEEITNICFDDPYGNYSLSQYYYIDDENLPIPEELYNKVYEEERLKWKSSITRVIDDSLIEDLI